MGLYGRYVLPRLVHFTCGRRPQMRQRAKVVPFARGTVLELGFGSGLNVGFYDPRRVERVWALEPAPEMLALGERRVREAGIPIEHLRAHAEAVPLDEASVDTVLLTYTLCTVRDAERTLAEVRRVLRPGGELLFTEHGQAPEPEVRRWQDRLNPMWSRIAGGCNLNRPIAVLLERAGFRLHELSTMYVPGWRPASFNYWGRALRD